MQKRLALCGAIASMLAGCGSLPPLDAGTGDIARGARAIVGTSLIGAHGKTSADQDAIDDTVVGICAAGVWTATECRRHGNQ